MKLKGKEIKKKFMKIMGMDKYSEIRCLLLNSSSVWKTP